MSSQWQNFLKNLGTWRGSFTHLDREGRELGSTPSILSLESDDDGRLVHFRLRRFADGMENPPSHDLQQDYRSLGRQVVFFETGAFSKGSLQVAPTSAFGAEYGFIGPDRRLRLVQLFDEDGGFGSMVLIREFRDGVNAPERPPLTLDQVIGTWRGEAATISADWPEPEHRPSLTRFARIGSDRLRIERALGEDDPQVLEGSVAGDQVMIEAAVPRRLQLLPDGAFSHVPVRVDHRHPFFVEAGWMVSPRERQTLVRRYDGSGLWISSTHTQELRDEV